MDWSLQKRFVVIIGSFMVLSMFFFLSRSLYSNYHLDKQIAIYEQENKVLNQKIQELQGDVAYFNTQNYKDKYAKEILNKLNPGEKVLVLHIEDDKNISSAFKSEILGEIFKTEKEVFDQWQEYFWGQEDIIRRMK